MTTTYDELRDTCQKIQAATGIDDRSWKVLYGNDEGLYGFIKARELAARYDERKAVALDNYHGHTFSDATDYKGKFDKFIDNNEKRIADLKSQQQENEG